MSFLAFPHGPSRSRSRVGLPLVGPIAGIVALALILSVGGVVMMARQQDQTAVEASQRQAEAAVYRLTNKLTRSVLDYAFWDDAVRNLDLALDPEWADANVSEWVAHAFGHEHTLVIDASGKAVYFWSDGMRRDPALAAPFVSALSRLIQRAVTALIDDSGRPQASYAWATRSTSPGSARSPRMILACARP